MLCKWCVYSKWYHIIAGWVMVQKERNKKTTTTCFMLLLFMHYVSVGKSLFWTRTHLHNWNFLSYYNTIYTHITYSFIYKAYVGNRSRAKLNQNTETKLESCPKNTSLSNVWTTTKIWISVEMDTNKWTLH